MILWSEGKWSFHLHVRGKKCSREVDRTFCNRGRMHGTLRDMILKGEMYSALSEEVIGFDERIRVFADAQT